MKSSNVHLVSGENLNGRYRIKHRIGQGGYGEVVAAFDERENRAVALKILHNEVRQSDPSALARMRQEAEILRSIHHPNIVTVYAIEDCDEGTFLVMELVEGRSISQMLRDEGPVSPERVLPLVHQILSALKLAHDQQILHRDIKPDNILLCEARGGAPESVKLVDFGIAKALAPLSSQDGEPVTLVKTRVGDVVGTPRYAAPEQVVGDPIGPEADLFSVGLVIAEWLTGTPRIKPGGYGAVMAQLIRPTPFDVSDCPPAWRSWLLGMIDKTPNGRYRSVDEAIEALQEQVPWSGFGIHDVDASDLADTMVETRLFVPPERLRVEHASVPGTFEQVTLNDRPRVDERSDGGQAKRYVANWGMLFVMVGLISCLLLFIIYRVITG